MLVQETLLTELLVGRRGQLHHVRGVGLRRVRDQHGDLVTSPSQGICQHAVHVVVALGADGGDEEEVEAFWCWAVEDLR